jgi:hypothetical protein
MSIVDSKRHLWFAQVVDIEDPLMLNRVRVKFDTLNNIAILNAIPNKVNGKETKSGDDLLPEFKWTEIDSFCCLPLLPIFLNITPKSGETVNIIFPNNEYKFDEQYYIQGTLTSPLSSYQENFNAQRMFAAKNRIENPKLLKNPTNNEYYITKTKGVFIEPKDMGIAGRGTADIIVKDRHVLLRAGKSTTLPDNPKKEINVNQKRSFIQLSDFSQRETEESPIESVRLQQDIQYVKSLVEWHIINPENNFNKFDFFISLYGIPPSSATTSSTLQIDSNVPQSDKKLITRINFTNKSITEIGIEVSKFLKQCNDGEINFPPNPIVNLESAGQSQFPLFFRPSPETYAYIESPSSGKEYVNVTAAALSIDYGTQKNGVGLLWSKNKTGQQFTLRKDVLKQKSIDNNSPITYNIHGGDKILLLSHESRIPSKPKIDLNDNTVYGIEQKYIVDNVLPGTDPMVRGDELMKFMNTVVRFLISHVHPFPGLPPVPVSTDGTNVADILSQLQNASETILNQNIRIN